MVHLINHIHINFNYWQNLIKYGSAVVREHLSKKMNRNDMHLQNDKVWDFFSAREWIHKSRYGEQSNFNFNFAKENAQAAEYKYAETFFIQHQSVEATNQATHSKFESWLSQWVSILTKQHWNWIITYKY